MENLQFLQLGLQWNGVGEEELVRFKPFFLKDDSIERAIRFRAVHMMGCMDVVEDVILMQVLMDGVVGFVDIGPADDAMAFLLQLGDNCQGG